MRYLDKVQNRFLSFVSYHLNIAHPPHEYNNILISAIFLFLNCYRNTGARIISRTYVVLTMDYRTIDALRMLERLDIQVSGHQPANHYNFAINSRLIRMMADNNNVVFSYLGRHF